MHSSQTYFPCDLRQNLLPQHGFSAQGDGSMRRGGPELQPGRVSPEMGSRVCSGATAAAFPHIPLLRAPLSKTLSPEETPFLSAGSFEEKNRKGNVRFLGRLGKVSFQNCLEEGGEWDKGYLQTKCSASSHAVFSRDTEHPPLAAAGTQRPARGLPGAQFPSTAGAASLSKCHS